MLWANISLLFCEDRAHSAPHARGSCEGRRRSRCQRLPWARALSAAEGSGVSHRVLTVASAFSASKSLYCSRGCEFTWAVLGCHRSKCVENPKGRIICIRILFRGAVSAGTGAKWIFFKKQVAKDNWQDSTNWSSLQHSRVYINTKFYPCKWKVSKNYVQWPSKLGAIWQLVDLKVSYSVWEHNLSKYTTLGLWLSVCWILTP